MSREGCGCIRGTVSDGEDHRQLRCNESLKQLGVGHEGNTGVLLLESHVPRVGHSNHIQAGY